MAALAAEDEDDVDGGSKFECPLCNVQLPIYCAVKCALQRALPDWLQQLVVRACATHNSRNLATIAWALARLLPTVDDS